MYISTVEELVQQDPSLAEVVANRPTISAKALAVSQATGITGISGIIGVILQILNSFTTLCGTPTAASVHQLISAPNRMQERAAQRIVRRNYRGNPAAQSLIADGLIQVGSSSTVQDTTAMYAESHPGAPPLQ